MKRQTRFDTELLRGSKESRSFHCELVSREDLTTKLSSIVKYAKQVNTKIWPHGGDLVTITTRSNKIGTSAQFQQFRTICRDELFDGRLGTTQRRTWLRVSTIESTRSMRSSRKQVNALDRLFKTIEGYFEQEEPQISREVTTDNSQHQTLNRCNKLSLNKTTQTCMSNKSPI